MTWANPVDLRDVPLDALDDVVEITRGQVSVYDGASRATKPSRGVGLNAPAIVALDGIFPPGVGVGAEDDIEGSGSDVVTEDDRVDALVRRLKRARGTRFIAYDAKSGTWRFRVEHFTRYGLDVDASDDDDDDDDFSEEEEGGGLEGEDGTSIDAYDERYGDEKENEMAFEEEPRRLRGKVTFEEDVARAEEEEEEEDATAFPGFAGAAPPPPRTAAAAATTTTTPRATKPAFAAPAADDLFASHSRRRPNVVEDVTSAHAARERAFYAQSFATGGDRRYDPATQPPPFAARETRHRLPPPPEPRTPGGGAWGDKNTGLNGAGAAVKKRSRAEPPMATAYAIAASVVGGASTSAARAKLAPPPRPRAPELATDAQSFLGASHRPSWGPGGVLAHAARVSARVASREHGGYGAVKAAQLARGSPHAPWGVVTTERFALSAGGGDFRAKRAALDVALARTAVAVDANDAEYDADASYGPRLVFECARTELPSLCLEHLAAIEAAALASAATGAADGALDGEGTFRAPPDELAAEVRAWDLVSALWGDDEDGGGAPVGCAADRHRRRAAVGAWLRKQTARGGGGVIVPDDRNAAAAHAAAGRSSRSVASAAANRDPRLATLLAQANAGGDLRALTAAQLDLWRGSPVEKYLTRETSSAFALLAGEVSPPEDVVRGDGAWPQNFGLTQWFASPPTTTLSAVVEGYLEAVARGEAAYPDAPGLIAVDADARRLKDASFNLLILGSKGPTAPSDADVRDAFHPLTYCARDLGNVSLAWHLFATLRAIGALPETVENRALGDALHANFARQLLSSSSSSSSETKTRRQQRHSMIEWAVFVAMHVEDGARRRDLVKEIINAGCAEWCDDDAKTTFMRETLRVPEAWTREAKETWARYNWWEPESAFAPA